MLSCSSANPHQQFTQISFLLTTRAQNRGILGQKTAPGTSLTKDDLSEMCWPPFPSPPLRLTFPQSGFREEFIWGVNMQQVALPWPDPCLQAHSRLRSARELNFHQEQILLLWFAVLDTEIRKEIRLPALTFIRTFFQQVTSSY